MNYMNRRRFVAVTSVTATSVLLVACGNKPLTEEELNPTQIPDVPGAPPTIAPLTATPGAATEATEEAGTGTTDTSAITIEAHDNFSFSPNAVDVAPGQTIKVVNAGFAQHDLVVDAWGVGTELLNGGDEGEFTVPADAEVGSTAEFHCTVVGHKESGMTGTFTVVEAAAAAPAEDATEETAEETEAAGTETSAAGTAEAITITGHDDFSYDPKEVDVQPGQTIKFVNGGFVQHDIYVDEWGVGTELLNGGDEAEFTIPADAEVGASVEFYCTAPGHKQSGMAGTFTVVEAAAAAPAEDATEEATEEATAEETEAAGDDSAPAAGTAEAITIEAHDDFSYDPKEVDVQPGQTIKFVNGGFVQHDIYVDEWGVGTELLNGGDEAEFTIPADAEVGASVEFYCTAPGHKQSGMAGTFTVVEGAAAAPAEDATEEATEEATAEETEAAGDDSAPAAGTAEAITIEAHDDFSFKPNAVDVQPGQTVTVVNLGYAQHDLKVDDWAVETELLNNGQEGSITIPADAEVGTSVEFYCTVVGHKQSGMSGTFTVVAASGEAATDSAAPAGEATAAAPADTAAVATPAAANTTNAVTLVGTKWKFEPAEFDIEPGGVITFQNNTGLAMGLSSETWDANALQPMIKSIGDGATATFTVPEDAEVGSEVIITSNLSEATKQGMEAKATIVAPGGSGAATPVASPTSGGASGGGKTIEITMLDSYAYDPKEIEASVGDTLHFINGGFMQHDAAVDAWSDEPLTPMLNPSETKDYVITDIAEVGQQYEFYCTVVGHKQLGMVGTVTIV